MLKRAKRLALGFGRDAGILARVRDSEWRRRRLAILCYHGVSIDDEHEWDPALFVTQDFLAARLEILARGGYNVLPLDEAVTRLYKQSLPPRSVVLTFDDGNQDFSSRAVPVLRQYGFPATVYLATYYCIRGFAVFDVMVRYLIWKADGELSDITSVLSQAGLTLRLPHRGRKAPEELVRTVKAMGWTAQEKEEFLTRLAEALGIDYVRLVRKRILHLMSPDEARDVADLGFDVQLHTHRHRTPSRRELFEREILDNAVAIRNITGRAPDHFCYPQGWVEPAFLPWLRELGVRSATTTQPGLASARSDPLLLPRIVDHVGLSALEFESWISGSSAFLPKRRNRPQRPL